jgi:hypothetical protein
MRDRRNFRHAADKFIRQYARVHASPIPTAEIARASVQNFVEK